MENLMADFKQIMPQYIYPKWACHVEPVSQMFNMMSDILRIVEQRDDRICRYLLSDTGALYNLIILDYTDTLPGFNEHTTREERVEATTRFANKSRVNLLHNLQHKRLQRTLLEDYPTALLTKVIPSTRNAWYLHQIVSLFTRVVTFQQKEVKVTYINLTGTARSRKIETQVTIAHVSFNDCDGV